MTRIKLLLASISKLHFPKEGTLASVVVRGVCGAFILKVWYALWLFGISILLARMLGTNGYGIYSVAISWSALIAVFAKLGQARQCVVMWPSIRRMKITLKCVV